MRIDTLVKKEELLQMKYILFVVENAAEYWRQKMRQAIQIKNPRKLLQQKPVLTHKAQEKGGPVTCSEKINQGERILSPNPHAWWVKKVLLCLLENMRSIRDGICTGNIRRRVYFSVPAG